VRDFDRHTLQFRIAASRSRADWALARLALLPWWAVVRRWSLSHRARLHLAQAELDEVLLREEVERRGAHA
jgi:hypothetical protein